VPDLRAVAGHLADPNLRKQTPEDWPDIRHETTDQMLDRPKAGPTLAATFLVIDRRNRTRVPVDGEAFSTASARPAARSLAGLPHVRWPA
jgi:hypothetical protein